MIGSNGSQQSLTMLGHVMGAVRRQPPQVDVASAYLSGIAIGYVAVENSHILLI